MLMTKKMINNLYGQIKITKKNPLNHKPNKKDSSF